jgi:hypothetical protein
MPETDDPRKALSSDDVAVRTAGARDLGQSGTFEDAVVLLGMAKGDRSPSVRLCAAAAAAEIVLRVSLAPEQRKVVLEQFHNFDPANNTSLPLVLAGVPDPEGIERLGRLMRDPRSDVRSGASKALQRMSQNPAAVPLLAACVRDWLMAGKHPVDAVAELVRLSSEAGFPGMDEALPVAARKGRAAALAVQEALDWIVARRDPNSWVGLWLKLGEKDEVLDWLWLEKGRVWGPQGPLGPLAVGDGVARADGIPEISRLRLGRAGDDGLIEALRVGDHTLWRHAGRALVKLIDELEDTVFRTCTEAALGVARELAPLEGTSAIRARAIALWRGGALREAEQVLDAAVAGEKRIKPEVQWLIANVKLGLGDLDTARDSLKSCLKTAPKKATWRSEAEALLGSLER